MNSTEAPDELPKHVIELLERRDVDSLEIIQQYVDELIAGHEPVVNGQLEGCNTANPREEVVDIGAVSDGRRVMKKVSCGRESCSACPHRIHEYRVFPGGDSTEWEHVGTVES